jgi:putative DNA primase/helicase
MDDGALIHEKGLEMVRNIYNDLLKTADWLLNVRNGTLDVTTGEFRKHRQEDMITKIARVDYDPAAECPAWKQFIREIMNYNSDIITFLQNAAGWARNASK